MKLKELTFMYKKGLPQFSSVSTSVTYEIEEGEDTKKVWDKARQECLKEANLDASWLDEDEETKAKKIASMEARKRNTGYGD
jgi:hypothetical protein